MGISYFPGDSIGIKPELEKGRKEAAEQHIVSLKLVYLAMLTAGMFAILSGLCSAVFAEAIRRHSILYWAGLIAILITVIGILYVILKLKKEGI